MITTNGAGRGRIVRSNLCASIFAEDAGGGVSPLLAVCHETALAPEEGGVPACGEDRRVASGTEDSLTWHRGLSDVAHDVAHDVAQRALRTGSPTWHSEVMLRSAA